MAELADAQDLKSWVPKGAYGFDSHPRHQQVALFAGAIYARTEHAWQSVSRETLSVCERVTQH